MAPARRVQKIQAADSGTESGSEESDSDPDSHPQICLAAGEDRASKDLETTETRPIQSVALSSDHGSTQSPDVGDI
ncbi:hypothetical protein PI125_g26502 [Phytophthora idaei]|nr:hypothetical protein PI125_g26502 [Phytophthora idaei]